MIIQIPQPRSDAVSDAVIARQARLDRWFALAAFTLLFPVLFFVRAWAGADNETLLGAYLPITTVALFAVGAIVYASGLHRRNRVGSADHLLFFVVLGAAITVAAIEYATVPRFEAFDLLAQAIAGVLGSVVAFWMCIFWKPYDNLSRRLAVAAAVLVPFGVVLLTNEGIFIAEEALSGADQDVAYQLIGRVLVVCGLFGIAGLRNRAGQFALFLLVVASLYQNGARTEFVLFLMTGSLMIALSFLSGGAGVFALLLGAFAVALPLAMLSEQIIAILPESRIMTLLEVQQSTSWAGREIALEYAWQTIKDEPLWGDYGSDYDRFGPGNYAHNLISAWVDLGLFGFTGFVLLVAIPAVWALLYATRFPHLIEVRLAVAWSLYAAFGYALSYHYLTVFIGLSWGSFVLARVRLAEERVMRTGVYRSVLTTA